MRRRTSVAGARGLRTWWAGSADRQRLLVLGWHNVSSTWCFPSVANAGVEGLAAQLRLLARGTTPVPLADGLRALRSGRPLPPRAVALTFDDGYADNLELAAPLLRQLDLPATFFLVPGLLSGTTSAWWEVVSWAFTTSSRTTAVGWDGASFPTAGPADRRRSAAAAAERLKRRPRRQREEGVRELVALLAPQGRAPGPELFLDWDGALRLVEQGFDVGSHTLQHDILTQETPAAVREDLTGSRAVLQRELDVPVPLLAYPNGTQHDFEAATTAAARAAGYEFAVTTCDGLSGRAGDRYEVPRSVVYPERGPRDLVVSLLQAARATP